jgi:hypothetical protein
MNPTAAQLHKNTISPLFTICYTFHVLLKATLTAESRMKNVSNQRFTLVQLGNRGGMFYCKDTQTKLRKSLETKDRAEAERLMVHKNEAAVATPHISRKIGLVYLADSDPEMGKRTWRMVMDDIIKDKHGPTLVRYLTALKDPAYKLIEQKLLVETLPMDFMELLRAGNTSTNVYLRRFQNHAVDMDWLTKRVLPKRKFPKIVYGEQRAIKWEEHCKIIGRERNPERRDFYELLWHIGGSQSDVACLENDDIDRIQRCFVYERFKNSELGGMQLGPKAWAYGLSSSDVQRPDRYSLTGFSSGLRDARCGLQSCPRNRSATFHWCECAGHFHRKRKSTGCGTGKTAGTRRGDFAR